ncbi:MAG: PHP domain-containing protein [Candidatus Aenigmarchaeota archaeon]|nr:PHP domain-containing protein [Candidatus Aenigmarchaeota archaeon]
MEIVNRVGKEDYHMHSWDYSDGADSVEQIIEYAKELGLERIAITDHSQACLNELNKKRKDKLPHVPREEYYSFAEQELDEKEIDVIFGIEGDLLNEEGYICQDIQGISTDFLILAAHIMVYSSEPENLTEGMIKAIERYDKNIKFIAHPYLKEYENLDIEKLIEVANDYEIPLELNCGCIIKDKINLDLLEKVLQESQQIYINSDSHNLNELGTSTSKGLDYLKRVGISIPK